jgi:hypothetical protein
VSAVSVPGGHSDRASLFAGVDVCQVAGFGLLAGTRGPVFEQDIWDFNVVAGLPVQLFPTKRRMDFAAIANPPWRLLAKELLLALLAPRHPAVALLPRAYRTPLHLSTCQNRLQELTTWLNWLTARGITSLQEVSEQDCEAYLTHRCEVRDEHGAVIGKRDAATRRVAVQTIIDLINYRELFTTDRVRANLRPWSGASPSAVAGLRPGRQENKTAPLPDRVLQPMLAAALYVTETLGPHVVDLGRQERQPDRRPTRSQLALVTPIPTARLAAVLDQYERERVPLPLLAERFVRQRLAAGWQPDDPLLRVSLDTLAHTAGVAQFRPQWIPPLRDRLQADLATIGLQAPWVRTAAQVPRADSDEQVPWTLPLHWDEVRGLASVVATACILVVAAVSGMRTCELMELRVGWRQPPEEIVPGLIRYRLAGKLIKGQPLGGTQDEWVVIQPVYRAVELAEQLRDDPEPGVAIFGRFDFYIRYRQFRAWVNGPAGRRLGLAPIPETPVSLRALRRTLALELAHRPGGLLAAKVHLKHITVATTEGYAARAGGAQAELLAEVNRHEQERNLELVLAEFRNYQQGILPAGPGARELTEFFASVDATLESAADSNAPKVQRSDREILNLLTKRAKTLHLGVANYCWFTDPARALCLKLAGTPTATKPLAGMCDSARCLQATHHPCHRPVWAEHATQTATFLGALGPTRKTERARLQADLDRAQGVLAAIAAATGHQHEQEQT